MRIVVAILAAALAGCGALPDDKVCTPINDAVPVNSVEEGIAKLNDLDWQRQRVEACLHRSAYKFARVKDDAVVVAKAIMERCQPAVGMTATRVGALAAEEVPMSRDTLDLRNAARVKASNDEVARLERMAVYWVVEGRAGNCR